MRKVIVVGAGAAGSVAAIFAATAGAETILIEGTRDGGRKILISGGGRCNVLPAVVDESRFVTESSPHLLRKMIRAWPLSGQRTFFEETLGIPLVEETASRKLFPASNRARDVRDGLLAHARACGVQVRFDTRVTGLAPVPQGWEVSQDRDETLSADAVIVATGGLSVPNTGSDGVGLEILQQLGHEMHATYAALTPLTAVNGPFAGLPGISLPVRLTAGTGERSATADGGMLFTHRGYSGPAVLDVSHVLVRARAANSSPAELRVRWADTDWRQALAPDRRRTVAGALKQELPDRLAAVILSIASVDPDRVLAELRREERIRLIDALERGILPVSGDEGYRKAEVTGGGIALEEVRPRTMESRRHAGLHLCGEVLDVFGPIGGYNFSWAWATGRAAGLGAALAAV